MVNSMSSGVHEMCNCNRAFQLIPRASFKVNLKAAPGTLLRRMKT